MLIVIGIVIVIIILFVLFYNDLISAKVKVEDAQDALKNHLETTMQINASNLEQALSDWGKNGLNINEEAQYYFNNLYMAIDLYNKRLKKFPHNVVADIFKLRAIEI